MEKVIKEVDSKVAPEEHEGAISAEEQAKIDKGNEAPFETYGEESPKPEETDKDKENLGSEKEEENPKEEEQEEQEETEEEKAAREEEEEAEIARLAEEKGVTVEEYKKSVEEEELKNLADEEGMTVEEYTESLEKDKAIVERHGGDASKIARALRKENSAFGKLNSEVESLRQYKKETETAKQQFSEEQFLANTEAQKDDIIAKYVELFPEHADLHEDVLLERARNNIKEVMKDKREEADKKLKGDAADRREELNKNLPEEAKDVASEVKEILEMLDDREIVDEGFDISFAVQVARGKKYTPEYIKTLEDAAYKRGKDEPKIKIKKALGSGDKSVSSNSKSKGALVYTQSERNRAVEIYGNREGWFEEKMIAEYLKNDKGKDFDD